MASIARFKSFEEAAKAAHDSSVASESYRRPNHSIVERNNA